MDDRHVPARSHIRRRSLSRFLSLGPGSQLSEFQLSNLLFFKYGRTAGCFRKERPPLDRFDFLHLRPCRYINLAQRVDEWAQKDFGVNTAPYTSSRHRANTQAHGTKWHQHRLVPTVCFRILVMIDKGREKEARANAFRREREKRAQMMYSHNDLTHTTSFGLNKDPRSPHTYVCGYAAFQTTSKPISSQRSRYTSRFFSVLICIICLYAETRRSESV